MTAPTRSLEDHAALLGRIGALLMSSSGSDRMEPAQLLLRVARLAVPLLGDLCAIDLLDDAGALHRAACAHVDAAKEALTRSAHVDDGFTDDAPEGAWEAIRTRRPVLVSPVPLAARAAAPSGSAQLPVLERIGATAWMVAPMLARERALGTLTLALTESGRGYDGADVSFAEAMAVQIAVALDHAALIQQAGAAREAAEAAARGRDEFLSTLSHELRAPLNAVYGWTTLLDRGQLDAEQSRHAYQVILRNVGTQVRLIEDMLDLSRVASGKIRLYVQPVDLQVVIEDALESVRPAAEAKGIRLQTLLASPGGPISGDRDRLQQIFWNLLGNAVKFTPRGGHVQVQLQRVGSQVEIAVSDTGQGIPLELLPHVFDRFRQGNGANGRAHSGLGLGLALVRSLVELHGGAVSAHSDGPGAGATFVLTLPVMLTGVAASISPEGDGKTDRAASPAGDVSLAGLRVLVVDDDPTTVELTRLLLVRAGADVRARLTAVEALETLRHWRPDVLLSDIEMPGLDGFALVRQLRAFAPADGGKTPAVAVSAYSRPENRVRSLRAGFNMHVSKPVEPSELIAIVASLAGRLG